MLLQVMKMSQTDQLPAATTVSSLCVTHVMQSQPGNGVSCFQSNESLDGCHLKIVPLFSEGISQFHECSWLDRTSQNFQL